MAVEESFSLSSEEKRAIKKGLTSADQDIISSSFNSKTLDVLRASKEVILLIIIFKTYYFYFYNLTLNINLNI